MSIIWEPQFLTRYIFLWLPEVGSVNLQQGDLQDTHATLTTLPLLLQVCSLHFEQAPRQCKSQALSSPRNQDLRFHKMSEGLMCTLKFNQDYDKESPEMIITGS